MRFKHILLCLLVPALAGSGCKDEKTVADSRERAASSPATPTAQPAASTGGFAPAPVQPAAPAPSAPAATVPAGWLTIAQQYFSFSYPAGWQTSTANNGMIADASEPGTLRMLSVEFDRVNANQAGILNQCAGVDAYLQSLYDAKFARLQTSTNQYPYTTVTKDGFQPGQLGGESTEVRIVHQEAYQNPSTVLLYLNAIPRADGIYLVIYKNSAEPMDVAESYRQGFLRSIVFKSAPLDPKTTCNYLGG